MDADVYLDIFKFDPKYVENEERYKAIKVEILGEDSEDEESGSEESSEEEEDEEGMLHFASPFGHILTILQLWRKRPVSRTARRLTSSTFAVLFT